MSRNVWPVNTDLWSVVPAQVALELRIFPIAMEEDELVLLTDFEPTESFPLSRFETMVSNNVGTTVRLVTEIPEVEFAFDELLDQFYGEAQPQVVSIPVAKDANTVLLVEPDRERAKSIRREFEALGHQIKHVSTLSKALEFLQERKVTMVFLSASIPEGKEYAIGEIESLSGARICDSGVLKDTPAYAQIGT